MSRQRGARGNLRCLRRCRRGANVRREQGSLAVCLRAPFLRARAQLPMQRACAVLIRVLGVSLARAWAVWRSAHAAQCAADERRALRHAAACARLRRVGVRATAADDRRRVATAWRGWQDAVRAARLHAQRSGRAADTSLADTPRSRRARGVTAVLHSAAPEDAPDRRRAARRRAATAAHAAGLSPAAALTSSASQGARALPEAQTRVHMAARRHAARAPRPRP